MNYPVLCEKKSPLPANRSNKENPLAHRLVYTSDIDVYACDADVWWEQEEHQAADATEDLYTALRRALDTELTDKQREAVELFFFEGLSQGEIARTLGISQQVVQKRIYGTHRNGRLIGGALNKLKQALQDLYSAHLSGALLRTRANCMV